jgi:hypothetical protein
MKILRSIKFWFYRKIKGYIPAGHLVLFDPPDSHLKAWPLDPRRDPEINGVGISLGAWRAFKSPGFWDVGTTVLIDGRHYNLYTWDLVVIDD